MAKEMTLSLVKPTVNINGDTREELVRQFADASLTLGNAAEELRKAMPHGRNYPEGTESYRAARAAMAERLECLRAMQAELMAIAIVLDREG